MLQKKRLILFGSSVHTASWTLILSFISTFRLNSFIPLMELMDWVPLALDIKDEGFKRTQSICLFYFSSLNRRWIHATLQANWGHTIHERSLWARVLRRIGKMWQRRDIGTRSWRMKEQEVKKGREKKQCKNKHPHSQIHEVLPRIFKN